jgi:hypothetical protein
MQKRLKFESLGFSFFQHSNTPVLQNRWATLSAKPLKLDLAHRTRFSLLKFNSGKFVLSSQGLGMS